MQENDQISLRALEPDDIELLYNWENNRDIWKISNTQVPFSKYILQKYIEKSHLDIYQTRQLRLMIDVEDKTGKRSIGCIDLFDFEPHHARAGIGVLIAGEKDRGKGYAKMALNEVIKYAFNYLKLHQLYCNIISDNTASLKLFKNAGFRVIGTKHDWIKDTGAYIDEIILQLVNDQN